ncbi:hypothetical protein Tco_1466890 [Tanacetum coccineum]
MGARYMMNSVRVVKDTMMNSKFKYHRDCKEVKLTKVIEMWILVKDADKIKILDILPFAVRKLPMKYLGVPLITKKIEEKNTLWVKWVKMVKLRGESIWEVQKGANDSWMWKCLLELRSKIKKHTFKVLGDGKNTKFWVDQWNSEGILIESDWPREGLTYYFEYKVPCTGECTIRSEAHKSHGDVDSVRTVKDTMMEFSAISGLMPNTGKSSVFFGSVKDADKIKILDILPFAVGKLPMKYLGVPLMTKKISTKECKQLIDKVKNKIDDWKNKYLSYAGRLQLIAFVLASLNVYQGGLGIRMFGKWNEILLLKNMWNIAEEKYTLWVKWVKMVKLIGESIWEVQKGANDSWILSGKESVWNMVEGYKWSWPDDWTLKYPLLRLDGVVVKNPPDTSAPHQLSLSK